MTDIPSLRFGIVGLGFIARHVAKAMVASGSVIGAVASRSLDKATKFADEFTTLQKDPKITPYGSQDDLLKDSAIDAIYIAIPTAVMADVAVRVAESGKHVLADKPFISFEELRRITDACKKAGVLFMDATHFPHHPRTKEIAEICAKGKDGELGEVIKVNSNFSFPHGGTKEGIRWNPKMEPMGALGDVGWYAVRIILTCAGFDRKISRVTCSYLRDEELGVIYAGSGMIVFEDECRANFDFGFLAGTVRQSVEVVGKKGRIICDDVYLPWHGSFCFPWPEGEGSVPDKWQYTKYHAPPREAEVEVVSGKGKPGYGQVNMIDNFAKVVKEMKTNPDAGKTYVHMAERITKVLDALYESGKDVNKPVWVEFKEDC